MRRVPGMTAAVLFAVAASTSWAEDPAGSPLSAAKDPSVGESWSSDSAPKSEITAPAADPAPTAVAVETATAEDRPNVTVHHAGPDATSPVTTGTTTPPTIDTPVKSDIEAVTKPDIPSATETAAVEPAVTPPSTDPAAQPDNDPGLDTVPESVTPATAPTPEQKQPEPQHTAAPVVPSNPPFLIGDDVREIVARARVSEDAKPDLRAVSAFYAARRGEVAWTTAKGLTPEAKHLVEELTKAADWGLDATELDLPDNDIVSKSGSGDDLPRDRLADAEFKISLAALTYARQARGGRITEPVKQLSSYLDRAPQLKEPSLILEDLAGSKEPGAYLRGFNPQHEQFLKLQKKYLELKGMADAAKAIVRIPSGGKIKPGDKDPQIALLRERLNTPPSPGSDVDVYDAVLVDAVKAIQTEKGLRADGIIGKTTRAALNDVEVPNPERILANMEQWRWMPEDLGKTYIEVNVPEFMFRVIHDGKVVHEERIVTGQIDKQTPVFSDKLETVIFHPRWNVPESIKVLELYPNLARGGGSFQRQGLKLMRNGRQINPGSVDWSSADIRNFDVYQPSGPSNVLGEIKFIFPNKHGVYMHDTTAKSLFNEASRPFSHGCMRVRDPRRYAEVLLNLDKGWNRSQIDAILDGGSNEEVPVELNTKIPVHMTYFTTRVDDSGTLQTFKDVYGHEQRIKLALSGRWNQIAVGADHLAPVKFERARYAYSPDDDWNSFFGGSYGNPTKKWNSTGKQGGFFSFSEPPPPEKPGKKSKQAKGNGANGDFFKNLFGNF